MQHDDFCILMFYWNYFNRKSIFNNFHVAYDSHRQLTPHVKVVEVARSGHFNLKIPGVTQMSSEQCLWQKERVINYAAKHLTDDYKYIAYVDADLLFTDPNWISKTKDKLGNKNTVVQPYSNIRYLPKGHTKYQGVMLESLPSLSKQVLDLGGNDAYVSKYLTNSVAHGVPGGAWAMSLDDLRSRPIYDLSIVGGADSVQSFMFLGLPVGTAKKRHTHLAPDIEAMEQSYSKWMGYRDIACVDQDLMHINHGSFCNRQYGSRYAVSNLINISTDLEEVNGLYHYTGDNDKFLKALEVFFDNRHEDE